MKHIQWAEIVNFHSLRKCLVKYDHLLGDNKTVAYKCKVKLHGTNAAVQIKGNEVLCQSRNEILTSGGMGFYNYVQDNKQAFITSCSNVPDGIIIFGEYCGSGVQKGVAISQIGKKVFVVFAAFLLDADDNPINDMIIEPEELKKYVKDIPDTYVLPWYNHETKISWLAEAESLEPIVNEINTHVMAVEKCDPWVKETFGIDGVGEGLVYYPISHLGKIHFDNLVFKAKGEKHSVVAHSKPAQVDPNVANSANAFADMVVTTARLEQGVIAIAGSLTFDTKNIGQFLNWIVIDVEKETKAELEASGLTYNNIVTNAIKTKARLWFLDNCKKL